MSLNVTFTGFGNPRDGLVNSGLRKVDVIRAGLTVGAPYLASDPKLAAWTRWQGKPPLAAAQTASERMELTGWALILAAFLEEVRSGAPVRTSPHFSGLESTAKSQASNRLGISVTNAIADRELQVGCLHHIADLERLGLVRPASAGRSRPDFAGLSATGDWIVIEAKGWSATAPSRTAMASAKTQAMQIATVGSPSVSPRWHAVSASLFDPATAAEVKAFLEDPDGIEDGENLPDLTAEMLVAEHYGFFARLLADEDEGQRVEGTEPFRLWELSGFGQFGLHERLVRAIEQDLYTESDASEEFLARVRDFQESWTHELSSNELGTGISVGVDGTVLAVANEDERGWPIGGRPNLPWSGRGFETTTRQRSPEPPLPM